MDVKDDAVRVEDASVTDDVVVDNSVGAHGAGTVRLFDKNATVLIPTPSPDPKGM